LVFDSGAPVGPGVQEGNGRTVAALAGRAMVAVNLGRGEMLDAINGNDDVTLPVTIGLDDASLIEGGKQCRKQLA